MGQYLREIEIQAESQMSARLTLLDEANDAFDPLEFDRFTRLQELTRLMAESLHDITAVQQNLLRNLGETNIALERQDLLNRGMHSDLMHVYAVPFDNIAERLQRVVRQTALSGDRLVVHFDAPAGGGILLVDTVSGQVISRIMLKPEPAKP